MAGGRKVFTNNTQYGLNVTLVIRKSADPRDEAGTKSFALARNQSSTQEYGDSINIYLNGIKLAAVLNGELIGQQYIVITRGSDLDNRLNMNNGVDFGYANQTFYLSTRQVG
jgi:hypothetical protein